MMQKTPGSVVYDRARLVSQTTGLLMALLLFFLFSTSAHADITTNLVGHWKLNETAGTSASDASGNGRTGTLVNGPQWTLGKYGNGVDADGINDYISVADNAVFTLNPATSYTWSTWVKNDTFTEWSTVWSQTINPSNFFYFYAHTSSDPDGGPVTNGISVYWWTNGGAQKLGAHSANNVLTAGQWSHVAISYNATQPQNNRFTIYVNGVDVTVRNDVSSVGTLSTLNPTNIRITANQAFGEYLNGTVDEVRFYNRLLSATEVQEVMNSGGTPDTTAPSVSLTAPIASSTVSGSAVTVSANASDNISVSGVQFKVNGTNLGAEDTVSPYSTTWNTLAVANGDYTLTAVARDAAGNSATSSLVTVTVNNVPDTTPPVLSTISTSAITSTSAIISWTTDEPSDTQVEYGLTAAYGATTTLNAALVTAHSQTLSGLTASTTYHYRVRSRDAAGNLGVSGDVTFSTSAVPAGPCDGSSNAIVCENSKPGNPSSEWDISGSGDASIQGFATDISVNKGQTVNFKINTGASNYTIDIYRMGYYGGSGARKVASTTPSAILPQSQPSCLTNSGTGLIDCGNWAVSASWSVPADAVSGIYFARLRRTDTGGASHIMFVVRDDAGTSDILFQTADTTWQAYNSFGGNSLYVGSPAGRAYKVSYNRPFNTRAGSPEDWVFNAEYPMVRWLERNGYDVSYFTGVDSDRNGARILQHKTFLSVGHDEYWSGNQRTNVEAARDAGVHLAFLSGNEVFWKTRWENSIDGSGTPYRTLVSYKETHANAKIDPLPNVWTGTWRDPRFSPPADGGRPENALTGTIFIANCCTYSMTAPGTYAPFRFWRNTAVAGLNPSQTYTFPNGTLGYEWDHSPDNGFRPAGLFKLSATTVSGVDTLLDYGSTYGTGSATHNLTMYRAPSGALVFGGGTVQWSWGLDSTHDRGSAAADVNMQQATVNLLADMGVQPQTRQSNLVAATQSSDASAPTATITSPASGSNFNPGASITVQGSASDTGGQVAGVEVSIDGGISWHPANGYGSWSYSGIAGSATSTTIRARAVDDSGNLGTVQSIPITIGSPDTTPPTASLTAPTHGATVFGTAVTVSANASDNTGVTDVQFLLDGTNLGAEDTVSPYSITWNTTTATNGAHTLIARARDAAGNVATSTAVSVTVSNGVVPTQGPGGPILIVASAANPFSTYYKEILIAEGFNLYTMMDISAVTDTVLAQYDVVILGEIPLTSTQATLFTDWVNGGGNLIAMRPHSSLAGLLGITAQGTSLTDAYFKVNTASAPGAGITATPMQYHSIADRYTLNGATEVATLYSNISTSLNIPAVTSRPVGSADGHAASFAFDLAKSVIYTRQGNPAWSGQERDGSSPIRPNDLFYPDYINLDNVAIPQADEAQRLLANMIQNVLAAQKPLPHFWYLPRGEKVVILAASDDHANGGTPSSFDQLKAASVPGCSVADWECLRATSWMYTSTPVSNAQAAGYLADGFEFGVHVSTGCADWTPSSLATAFTNDLQTFQAKYTSQLPQKTNRTHCIAWSDYDTHPAVELSKGIRLDMGYYYWPDSWVLNRPGFMTGSGLPMRYADRNGTTMDVYQAATHLVNENGVSYPAGINTMIDKALGTEGYYGVLGTHYDFSDNFFNNMLTTAQTRGVPLVTALQVLDWTDGRNASSFGNVTWNAPSGTLGFTIVQDSKARGLTTLIPAVFGSTLSTLTKDGVPVPYTLVTVKGVQYAQFASDAGTYQAVYVVDTTPPTTSLTAPTNGATVSGTAVTVSANASDNTGVTGVQFILDGANLGAEDTVSPYSITWNTTTATNGAHTLIARARDATGNVATSTAVSVTVDNPIDTAPPILSAIAASPITSTSAAISWTTDEPSDTQVEYGPTTAYGATTTLNAALVTAHSQTLSGLTASTTYHYRVRSTDGTGNSASSTDQTFTTLASAPQSIFTTQVPDGSCPASGCSDGPGANYELGTRFTSTASGQITAIRFYKASNESGTHTGRIWSASGQQLASVVFSNEGPSGWQVQALATPLSIAANTEYLVSVNTGNSYYVASDTGLQSQIVNGDLKTVVGGNGRYGSPPGVYPTNTFLSSNYFRDIVFTR